MVKFNVIILEGFTFQPSLGSNKGFLMKIKQRTSYLFLEIYLVFGDSVSYFT